MNPVTDNKQGVADTAAAGADTGKATIELLRRFHYGEPAAAEQTARPAGAMLPALLDPYRDSSAIRYRYPIYLVPPGDASADELAKPVSEHFSNSLRSLAPDAEDARILKDNVAWIERFMRQKLSNWNPVDAGALFAETAAALQDHLNLDPGNRERLDADLERLKASAIAPGGQFLGYGPRVSLHLMVHAIRHRRDHKRERFGQLVLKYVHGLQSLLNVEQAKSSRSNETGSISGSVGPASRYIDNRALSGMLEQRTHGSVAMSAARRTRIEHALRVLEAWEPDAVAVRFVGRLDDQGFSELPALDVVDSSDPCTTAGEVFRRDAERIARVFTAVRIAALEIEDSYNAAVHDSWFGSFDWQAFSNEEMQLLTPVVALVSADNLAGDGLPSFSRLLGSRLPVHVLSWVRAYDNPGAGP
ncbi:MAG: ferredoxin, partial [Gammaproteobacteria bacterium]|nr:ferredoxin [Gammaproteobacteria bacterium]